MSFIFSFTISLFTFWAQQLPMKIHYILYFFEISNIFWVRDLNLRTGKKHFSYLLESIFLAFHHAFQSHELMLDAVFSS